MGISLTTGKRNVTFLNRKFISIQRPWALLAVKHGCLPANYLGLREVLHSRTYRSEPICSPLAREIPPAPLERWPTVVFKLVTIEQANDYLMVYCHTGPTISTLAYTFVLPSLQFSASVGNINISLAYTGLPDGLWLPWPRICGRALKLTVNMNGYSLLSYATGLKLWSHWKILERAH